MEDDLVDYRTLGFVVKFISIDPQTSYAKYPEVPDQN